MASQAKAHSLFDPAIVGRAVVDSFVKLDPRRQVRNPVMFTVYVGSILTTGVVRPVAASRRGRAAVVHSRHLGVAVVHGVVRQFCRGDGRRTRQGPGRRAARRPGTIFHAKKFLIAAAHGAEPRSRRSSSHASNAAEMADRAGRRPSQGRRVFWSRRAITFPSTAR